MESSARNTWISKTYIWAATVSATFASIPFVYAGPLEELRSVSGLTAVTQPGLLHGEIFSERGTQGNFARGAYAESCYFIKAPVATVGSTLLHWDPSKYKETEVAAYQTYSWPASPDIFKKFQLSLARPADRQLIDWSRGAVKGEKGNLHLRPADDDIFRRHFAENGPQDAAASTAWQTILQQRNDAVASGGFAALPPYPNGASNLRAAEEYKNLLKMTPSIAAHFASITGARPVFADGAQTADETVPYAEQSDVNGHTSFCLGTLSARKTPEHWQIVDCSYYTADTYFLSLSLYQLWPWENGTLVWEVDYVSAPFRSYLGGVDRLFAGKELSKESTQAVRLFRRVAEGKAR